MSTRPERTHCPAPRSSGGAPTSYTKYIRGRVVVAYNKNPNNNHSDNLDSQQAQQSQHSADSLPISHVWRAHFSSRPHSRPPRAHCRSGKHGFKRVPRTVCRFHSRRVSLQRRHQLRGGVHVHARKPPEPWAGMGAHGSRKAVRTTAQRTVQGSFGNTSREADGGEA